MTVRLLVAAGVVGLAVVAGLAARRNGDERWTPDRSRLPSELLPPEARDRLAVLGFSSRFCMACRRTPDVVDEARELAGVDAAFVDVDVSDRPDLVDALGLQATPTVLLVDPDGRIRYARQGNPEPGDLAFFLEEALSSLGEGEDLVERASDLLGG